MTASNHTPRSAGTPRGAALGRASALLLAAAVAGLVTPFVSEVLAPGHSHPLLTGLTFGTIVVAGLSAAVTGHLARRRGIAVAGLLVGLLGVPAIAAVALAFPGFGHAL